MIGPLLFLAAAAADYGTSPLVQSGHAHRWTLVKEDEDLTGWLDEAWRGETVIEGVRYKQVLVRSELNDSEIKAVDAIAVVDCQNRQLGMQRLILLKSSAGDNVDVPSEKLELQPAELETDAADRRIFAFACGTGAAR